MRQRAREFAWIVAVLWALWGARAASDVGPGGANPAAGSITISGQVMDAQGEPVEGARVALVRMVREEGTFVPEPKVVNEKDTAADGTFTLIIPAEPEPQETGYVVAHKKGLALAWISRRTQESLRLNFVLGEAKDLSGEVVDENGRPVAEAVVRVFAAVQGKREKQKFLSKPEFLLAQTDATGRFLFADLPADATVEFTVEKPGWAALSTYDRRRYMGDGYQFAPGQAGIRLVLVRGATVVGVVVDRASGKPVGEVNVVALPASVFDRQESRRPVTTRADGTFRIESLPAGTYTVQLAGSGGHMAEWTAEPVQVVLRAGDTKSDVKLQLAKGSVIEVRVTDKAGQPVARAQVNVHSIESDQGFNGMTDDKGLAQMRVAPGRYILSNASKEGYSRRISQEHITVEDGETTRIEYVLDPVSKIAGIVRDEAGNPLAGVKVSVVPMAMNETQTDASGRFELTGSSTFASAPGMQCMLMARDAQRDLAGVMEMEEGADDFDVTVKPAVTITGTVLNHEGAPLEGARIRVMLNGYRWTAPLGRELITTGPDGTFEIKMIPADCRYTVSATAGGYGKQDAPVDTANLQGHRYDAGQFRLPLANLSVTGTVVDPNDEPVAGANVRIMGDTQPDMVNMQAVHTDPEGRFTVQGLSPGSLRLIVNTRGTPHLYGTAQIEAGAIDVRIIVSDRSAAQRYVPRTPLALVGKPLPALNDLGIDLPADAKDRMLLACFWDMSQRPSRYCMTQLAAQAAKLGEKGVAIVGVQAAAAEDDALRRWVEENQIPFPIGRISADVDKTRFAWGVVSLPHLILTDRKHVVIAEGFPLSDLDEQIDTAAQQQ